MSKLEQDGDYYFGEKFPTPEGLIEATVYYRKDGVNLSYLATGEDNIDLMRDWAFEWLDIFGNGEIEYDDRETTEPSSTH